MAKGMAEFQAFANGNDAVKKELEAARGTGKAKELYAAVVKIAAKHGFAFTVADIEADVEKATAKALKSEELSDEQLDLVAGGKGGGGVINALDPGGAISCGTDPTTGLILRLFIGVTQ